MGSLQEAVISHFVSFVPQNSSGSKVIVGRDVLFVESVHVVELFVVLGQAGLRSSCFGGWPSDCYL